MTLPGLEEKSRILKWPDVLNVWPTATIGMSNSPSWVSAPSLPWCVYALLALLKNLTFGMLCSSLNDHRPKVDSRRVNGWTTGLISP